MRRIRIKGGSQMGSGDQAEKMDSLFDSVFAEEVGDVGSVIY
jgi:hypothetical protein